MNAVAEFVPAVAPLAALHPTLSSSPLRRDLRGRFLPRRRVTTGQRVLFVVSEMADFVKAGGLGDVAASLPRALRSTCDVRVLIPGYPDVLKRLQRLERVGMTAPRGALPACVLARAEQKDGLPVYVLLNRDLFERAGSPYVDVNGLEWADNAVRFATLAHAASQIAAGRVDAEWVPQLLHLNDWPSALAAAYVRWDGIPVPTLLTIHNLAYQGLYPLDLAPALGIPKMCLDDMRFHGQLSFLQAGIVNATRLNTVSVRYARQITAPDDGCGLHELLARRAARGHLSGIVNGIDASWDPRSDQHLRAHFSVERCEGRQANAESVRAHFGLRPGNGPLFAVVSRLVHQKGLDLTCEVAPQIVAAGGQLVVIGGGEPQVEDQVRELADRHPGQVGAFIGFEEGLARQMFAGADFLLMPSRFEPCGLSQMYAQRFGCLPVAHATGGLVDTVDDGVTGFLFNAPTADSMRSGVARAMRTYRLPGLLQAMRRAAMMRPSGWDIAGKQYVDLYQQAQQQVQPAESAVAVAA